MIRENNLGHLMIDIETLGINISKNIVILSIAAVEFDLKTGELGREFYERVDIQSCLDLGMKVDASTLFWWLKQNPISKNELFNGDGDNILNVLNKLTYFIKSLNYDVEVWGNGISFDLSILTNAYVVCGFKEVPWNTKKERDVRTLVSLLPEIKKNLSFNGIRHNPIDDCKHQIKYCHMIWKTIMNKS